MKYVALLSGGKDSCYNLLHCFRNGHKLVAAASLGPEHGKEELDSYLYQTVGQDAIEFVARALDVPLYRRIISGAAVEQGAEYGSRKPTQGGGLMGDETEDLYELLSTVKEQHPDVEGVSVGAILSNYQRVRVEHVCRRLGLTPLCYLWQRDQAELLSEMIEAGIEAVLIKVAGIGLTVNHLGKNLGEMQQTLTNLNDLYGSHICGEGGEYETLTLDCPLFTCRIRLTEVETVIHSDSDFAVVAYLRIKNAVLEPKSAPISPNPVLPPLLSEEFDDVRDVVQTALSSTNLDVPTGASSNIVHLDPMIGVQTSRVGHWVAIANVSRAIDVGEPEMSVEEEVQDCFRQLEDRLGEYNLTLSNCTNINIFLSSMDLFARVNAVYATFFGTSPPARACVAVDLPSPMRVKLDCIAYAENNPSERQALHVQSLSYWGPANIGPYSQAIVVDERVFISGQIGLVPSSLTLPSPPSLACETALSFQHVDRIVTALKNNSGGGWEGHEQGVLYWVANEVDIPHVKKAAEAFRKDVCTPMLFLTISALPKSALVEKQVLSHTGRCLVLDDDDIIPQSAVPVFKRGDLTGPELSQIHWEVSHFDKTSSTLALVCFRGDDPHMTPQLKNISELRVMWRSSLSVRLFYIPSKTSYLRRNYDDLFDVPNQPAVTSIPCRHISTRGSENGWDYAMFIVGT